MSLTLAVRHALKNPIQKRHRQSISRFGAVLTDHRHVYHGWNTYRTHPLQYRFARKTGTPEKVSCHAEISAIVRAVQDRVRDFSGYTLYVARVLKDGTPAMSCPCVSCWAAIHEFGIKEVYWTE